MPTPGATLTPTPLPTPTYAPSGGGGGGSIPAPTTIFVTTPTPTVTTLLDWSIYLIATAGNEGSNHYLAFGTKPNATNDFDIGLDVPHPPAVPDSTFNAYFLSTSTLFPQLDEDYQAPLLDATDIRIWELTMTSATNDITLSWDISAIPPELGIVVQTDTTVVDMRTQSSMVIPAGDHIITISSSR